MNRSSIHEQLKAIAEGSRTDEDTAAIAASLSGMKSEAVRRGDQEDAKQVWVLETVLAVQNHYLQAFSEMKGNAFYRGWCSLEQCEVSLMDLRRHCAFPNLEAYRISFIDEHVKRYQELFPYRLFLSPEIVAYEKKCNICGQTVSIRNPCGHEVGEIYEGIMCCRIVTKVDVLGIALVKTPSQKYSVAFSHDPETDKKKDQYRYDLLEYLMACLESPFHGWAFERTTRVHPHSLFRQFPLNGPCPCNSGSTYSGCCLGKGGVALPHHEFTFEVRPPQERLTNKVILPLPKGDTS